MTILTSKNILLLGLTVAVGTIVGLSVLSRDTSSKTDTATVAQNIVPATSEATPSTTEKKILSLDVKLSRTVFLNGEMGYSAILAADKIKELSDDDSKEPINLMMTSPGGSVLAGAVLLSAIQSSKAPVRVICKAICASMAVITLEYGTKRYATDRTVLMFHPASGGAQGDIDRMHSQITMIKNYVNKMEADISKRMGLSFEAYKNLAAKEIWIDAADAKDKGYIDDIVSLNIINDRIGSYLLPSREESPEERKSFNQLKEIFTSPSKENKRTGVNITW